ncbi:sugar transferase [Flavobacteriaceae bacterium S356]|uniref:Sugar transferase n=1 Tax=Asprobacillus argus TaxID=3076534 RepID=A0ABU3LIB2_9FLAO|nr:sugar transferase [Flavobacteriaceae bacterium S356]
MSKNQKIIKRVLDFFLSLLLIFLLIIPILVLVIIAAIDTRSSGIFVQERIGIHSKPFNIFKLRTFTIKGGKASTVGTFLRKRKLDELPQLLNVLRGDMSFVGPRPDIKGYADKLKGEDRIILSVKPGITGPASLEYRNEENMLKDASLHIDQAFLWKKKVEINKRYIREYSLGKDIGYMLKTIFYGG